SDADFSLSVAATTTDGSSTAVTTGTITVSVDPDADTPTLVVHDASGTEDQPIALDLSAVLNDTDGSESLSITISGVPDGAELSAGVQNADGSWTLSAEQLSGLTITPPANSDADFSLSVAATATDGSDTAVTTGTITVSVDPDADAPTLVVHDISGSEDQPIPLAINLSLNDLDGSETISGDIVLTDIPDGATLNMGHAGAEAHTWIIPQNLLTVTQTNEQGSAVAWEIPGLQLTPAADSDADFTLGIQITTSDGVDTFTANSSFDVTVMAVADDPTLTMTDASGDQDHGIALDIVSGLGDIDGSETLTLTIGGVPAGAVLSAGTDNHDGTWSLSAGDLDNLTITPPPGSHADFSLTVTATATEADGGDAKTITGTLDVSVREDLDGASMALPAAAGNEDSAIGLNIRIDLNDTDGSESLSGAIILTGVPEGAVLNIGHAGIVPGTWEIPQEALGVVEHNGSGTAIAWDIPGLTLQPPSDSNQDFSLGVQVTTLEDGEEKAWTSNLDVQVAGVADAPEVSLGVGISTLVDVAGNPATQVYEAPITISAQLADTDGSETLSIVLGGLPQGAALSAGVNNGDGTWTLAQADLQGLSIQVPKEAGDSPFNLTATATATENDGDVRSVNATLNVDFTDDYDPQAQDDTGATQSATPVTIDVLANDTSPTDQQLSLHAVEGAENGTVAIVDGKLVYTPDGDFTGVERLTYTVIDQNGHADTGSVVVNVGSRVNVQEVLESGNAWPGAASSTDKTVINASDGVSDAVHADLYPEGGTITLTISAQAPADSLPDALDLYILQDLTGSYKDDINTIRGDQNATNNSGDLGILDNLVQGINALVPDTRYGLGSFKDAVAGVDTTGQDRLIHDLDLKADTTGSYLDGTTSSKGYDKMSANGGQGGNPNEDQITALNDVAIAAINNQYGFRAGVPKVVVIATDAPSDTSAAEIAECAANLQAANIVPIFLVADGWADLDEMGFYRDIVDQMGRGGVVELSLTSDNLVEAVRSAVQQAVGNIQLNIEGDEYGYAHVVDHSATGDGLHTWTVELDAALYDSHSADSLQLTVTDADGNTLGTTTTVDVTAQIDIAGTAYNDVLTGHQGDNVIAGDAGDDVIHGLGGSDTIDGGADDDTLYGDAGDDTVHGGTGDDTVYGGTGDDTIDGGAGSDTLWGEEGNDLFIFGAGGGHDSVDGGVGASWLDSIELEGVVGGPAESLEHVGDWTLDTNSGFTVDADSHHIDFDDPDASGTITLADGSVIEFHNIEHIQW
ncbi:MAG: cadherin-like domain-containing protein, partial [Nitrospirae bacterium]|nr:cadherin-like domain-containing protein [Magnetococcales bacterium]